MAVDQKMSNRFSRRSLLTGGLAGGFLLAFHLPVRAVNEPVQPPDVTEGKFAPNAFIRIDISGKTTLVMPQVEMGTGRLHLDIHDSGGRTRRRFLARGAGARTAQRQALRQSNVRHSGHRKFQFDPGVVAALAHCRRQCARMLVQAAARQWQVDPASCTTANGEVIAQGQRAPAFLWRAGACGEQRGATKGCPAEGPEGFRADRQAAEAARHPPTRSTARPSTASMRYCPHEVSQR